MEVIFLDPGLIGKAGHSYNLAKILSDTLTRRNLEHRIFGMKALDPSIGAEIGAIPHFTRSLYECVERTPLEQRLQRLAAILGRNSAQGSPHSEPKTWKIINQSFESDLRALPQDVWEPDNIVALPAITQNQLFGLVRFLRARAKDRLATVVCHLMFPPSYVPWAQVSQLGAQFYRDAFAAAAGLIGRTLFFTTENEAMQTLYWRDFGMSTKILPLPFGAPAPKKESRQDGRIRLGFLGDSRRDKGFHLLPRAVELCERQQLDVEFIIQIQHGGWEQDVIEAEAALRALPNVLLVEGMLTTEEYNAWTREIDIMLLPYDPVIFGLRGSGVFTESVAAGLPIIASGGTFAAKSIEKDEAAGEVFAPHTSEGLAAAIARLMSRQSECKAEAQARALDFAHRHSGDAFVDVLLAHARGGRA